MSGLSWILSPFVLMIDGSEVASGSWKGLKSNPIELGERAGRDLKEKIGDAFF